MTSVSTVSLAQALDYGHACYYREEYPWRIWNGIPLVGVPRLEDVGDVVLPVRTAEGKLIYAWKRLTKKEVLDLWPSGGWVLASASSVVCG